MVFVFVFSSRTEEQIAPDLKCHSSTWVILFKKSCLHIHQWFLFSLRLNSHSLAWHPRPFGLWPLPGSYSTLPPPPRLQSNSAAFLQSSNSLYLCGFAFCCSHCLNTISCDHPPLLDHLLVPPIWSIPPTLQAWTRCSSLMWHCSQWVVIACLALFYVKGS